MTQAQAMDKTMPVEVDYDPFADGELSRVVPTTEPQRELWLASRLGDDASMAFNESVALRLRGPLDLAALGKAVQEVVARHDALRANFGPDGETFCVRAAEAFAVPLTDLSALSPEQRTVRIQQAKQRGVDTPFVLENGELFRTELLRLQAQEHLLLMHAHHIVCDGWSWWVVVREMGALYAQYRDGGEAALPPAESYADYALAEATHPAGAEFKADDAYWLSRFADEIPALDLPVDHVRPARRSFASLRQDYLLDAELVSALRRMGARRGASLFATLLAGFAGTLSRITGQSQVIVGIPAAGQSVDGHDDLVGHCVNLLPLRFDVDPTQSFARVLDDAQETLLDALEHQRYTFGTLLKRLHVERDPSRLPLVSVMFNIDQALDSEKAGFPGLELDFTTNPRSHENFELSINAVQVQGQLRLECQYHRELFDAASIRNWLSAYEALLRAAVERPEDRFSSLSLLDAQARAELDALQPAPVAYDRECRMHEHFERQCDRTPERIALRFGQETSSYAALEQRANRIAHLLRQQGIRQGMLVGLALDRGPDLMAGLLGILKAGAGYVPLDPQFPADRLAYMASDAGLAALLTESAHAANFDLRGRPVLALDRLQAELNAASAARLGRDENAAQPESPAYVIYTSGSTGRPKGVQVPHRAVANFLQSMASEPGIDAQDRLLAVTTLSFDIAVLELMLPLAVGAEVVLADKHTVMDGMALKTLLADSGATVMQATPATWRMLLEAGWQGSSKFTVLCGGEPLPVDLAAQLLPCCEALWNLYGPTETTVWSTCMRVSAPATGAMPDIHIGRPIANTQVWIVDEQGGLCPRGVPGEICIGGEGVTLGYLDRAELTAEKFQTDDFAPDNLGAAAKLYPTRKLYRTGDRGRWRSDGNLEHMGRLDFQVKVRGYRIELGEIEGNLVSHPGVGRAVVIAREDRPGDVRLVAYVVPQPQRDIDEATLLAHLRKVLPDYMIPQHLLVLDAVPLLPNGKLDRKALPAPGAVASAPAAARVAARDPLETTIAEAMEAVLGRPGIGVHDGFFELGGHSLLAAQLCARLSRELGTQVGLRTLFEAPTVARLAEVLRGAVAATDPVAQAAQQIPNRADQSRAPMTLMQQRLWFFEQMEPGSVTYNTPSAHRLRGPMDLLAFERTFQEMLRRQPSLRTVMVSTPHGAEQQVRDAAGFSLLPVIDLSLLPEAERLPALMADMEAQTAQPFELENALLFRARLYRLGDDDHALYFMTHHLIWDGWSFDVFYSEMSALYAAYSQGQASPLPELEVSYGDFAQWHAQWLDGPELKQQIGYWTGQLQGALEPLHLPEDKPRPARASGNGGTQWVQVNRATADGLREIGKSAGATLFMTLLAAYYVLLHRLGGQDDLVVGLPVRNRNSEALEKIMGFFVNVLPLRMKLDPAMPFLALVEQVRHAVVEAFAYPDVPFEHLIRELQVPRDASRSPVYQALFSFQDVRARQTRWGELEHEHLLMFQKGMSNDIGLWFLEHEQGLSGAMGYNTDILSEASAQLINHRFVALLESFCGDPQLAIGDANLLCAQDSQQLANWNATAANLPAASTLHALLKQQALRSPQRTALHFNASSLTYQQLDARAERLADALHARGVKPGDLVGISLDRSSDLVATMIAVLKTGAAYVPLDPAYPVDRLRFMAEDARLALIVGQGGLVAGLDWPREQTLLLDIDAARIDAASPRPTLQDTDLAAQSPAYVIYTSGSTGKPKGVVVPHGAVVNFLASMQREPGLTADDRLLAVTTTSFDIAVLELFLPLITGAQIVLADRDTAMDGAALAALIDSQKVSVMQATPSTWRILLEAGWRGGNGFKALCGGEPLPLDLATQLRARGVDLWNMYGPTETTVWSSCWRVDDLQAGIPIGTPIANTLIWILDARGNLCPPGVSGEIHIGGMGVAVGYLHRPELTAERFIPDHIVPASGGLLYRTGDRGRWRLDGQLEHQGRLDFQVKVRGHRIELGEIENQLTAIDGVANAIVLVREDRPGDVRLVAYVIKRNDAVVQESALINQLAQTLPGYMLPQHVVMQDALPLLPNGKIDRKSLPAPSQLAVETDTVARKAPRNDIEQKISHAMAQALGVPAIGVDEDFFAIGGHSLLAMQLNARLGRELGTNLPLRALFDHPTPERLAVFAEVMRATGTVQAPLQIPPRPVQDQGQAPLSRMQQSLWLLEQFNTPQVAMNLPSAYRLHGALDLDALQGAFAGLVKRQPVLRTAIVEQADGTLVQSVAEQLPEPLLPVEDLSMHPQARRESELQARCEQMMLAPFELARAPLFRARLFRLQDDEHVLQFVVHHILWDGGSFELYYDELVQLYTALAGNTQATIPPLETTYGDFSAWQRDWLQSAPARAQVKEWLAELTPLPDALELPADRARPPQMSGQGKTLSLSVAKAGVDRLRALGQRQDATLSMTLLATYALLLHRLSGQEELVIGVPVRGREIAGVERLMGLFRNTLPLRLRVDPQWSFSYLVGQVRSRMLEALARPQVPFEELVHGLAVGRDLSRHPIYQALFSFQDRRGSKAQWPGLRCESLNQFPRGATEDIGLWLDDTAAGIDGGMAYNADLLNPQSAERIMQRFLRLLESVVEAPDKPLAQLDLLAASEHAQLQQWNATQADYPRELAIHQLFEAQADLTPTRTAISFEQQLLDYAGLEARSNRIAQVLRSRGVGAGALVGLCLERGFDMVAAVLAVLKAGAAYVPLDPVFPADRLAFMAEDAGLTLMVSTSDLAGLVEWPRAKTLLLDTDANEMDTASAQRLPCTASPSALAYVLYTSGSTGKPKGVQVPHGAVVNFLVSMQREPGLHADDRLLAVTTLSFDIAALELFLPLMTGAEIVLANREQARDGDALHELARSREATLMQATPTTWQLLLEAGWQGRYGFRALVGGEALPLELARRLEGCCAEVWNMYGPTETTVWSTCWKVQRPDAGIWIGKPIANTSVWILGEQQQLCPIGVPGEIWIGGEGVTDGYLHRPELTAERFIADPFSGRPGARLYRTGDRGRWLDTGMLQHLGRLDFQVKVRGYRIELGEIEGNIADYPGVARVVVLAREDRPGDVRLVAYLVPHASAQIDEAGLQEHLKSLLPNYMVPQHLVTLAAIPLLPNGKVDRKALPPPQLKVNAGDGGQDAASQDPRVAADARVGYLVAVWSEMLGTAVGPDDNFFDLGGHSMLAVQMASRVAREKGVRIRLMPLATQTLASLAAELPLSQPQQATTAQPAGWSQRLRQALLRLLGKGRGS